MDIYIKPNRKAVIFGESNVYLKDVAGVYAPDSMSARLKNVKVLTIDATQKRNYILSVIDIVKEIDSTFPGCKVNNLGEQDVVVCFEPAKKKSKLWLFVKIFCVSMILLVGASTAIMSFHTDAQIPLVFKNYSYIFFREIKPNNLLFDIPYSLGIAVGIIVFYNHLFNKMLTNDPTPIEVEMSMYDTQVTNCLVDMSESQTRKESDSNAP